MRSGDSPPSPSDHEPVVVRGRAAILTCAVLLAITAAAWLQLVSSMSASHDAMEAMGATLTGGAAFVASWAIMMAAMMLPSALPMIALYGAIQRKSVRSDVKGVPVALFTLVYLAVWAAAGLPVYLGSVLLDTLAPEALPYAIALVLVAAGIYQLSPFKQACLRACRSPLGFLMGRWRAGYIGSLALGWAHAAYCLGCCWALMIVLVAAGAMGLAWVLLIAVVVTAEKLLPAGEWIARITGGALVLLGVLVAARPDLVMALRGAHGM